MATVSKIAPGTSYSIEVVGARRPGFDDLYHALLRMSWPAALGVIAGVYLALNVLFAAVYVETGGVANAAPGSFVDAFYFSVQTFGTIGYGGMYPSTHAANAVVVVESIVSLVTVALSTGLVFVRFSLVKAKMVFSRRAAIGPMDGVPALQIRLGNDRSNQIFDAQMRLMFMFTTTTKEGVKWYRSQDLPLVRERAPALSRSWTILHRIDDASPLKGMTPEKLKEIEAELTVTVSGVDDTSMQAVHARHTWEHFDVAFGARLADVLTDLPNGDMRLDLTKFHTLVPTPAIDGFPWVLQESASAG